MLLNQHSPCRTSWGRLCAWAQKEALAVCLSGQRKSSPPWSLQDQQICGSRRKAAATRTGSVCQGIPNSLPAAIQCPAHTSYQPCMSACPASCANLAAPSACEAPCVEGCASAPGYVLSGLVSVPYSQCGCSSNGQYYQVGASAGREAGR